MQLKILAEEFMWECREIQR